jgi:hypothetical protein
VLFLLLQLFHVQVTLPYTSHSTVKQQSSPYFFP